VPPLQVYLDQNYLSGMVKGKPAFVDLEPVLRAAVGRGAIRVPESAAHRLESARRPDLPLLKLLRELSGGSRLPEKPGAAELNIERRLARFGAEHFPDRPRRDSDAIDRGALAIALPRCALVACDSFMADVIRRAGLDRRFRCEVFGGRRRDVERLTARLGELSRD
jgi:hypothetical protein